MAELPPFDPEWLAAEKMGGGRIVLDPLPVDQLRAKFEGIFASMKAHLPPPTDAVKAEDVHTNGQRIRIYTPTGTTSSLPVGLYIHCGGWFSGSIENEDNLCRNIAENSQIILFSPEYRLAPEHPYPAGLNDCCAAYEWMHENAAKYHGNNRVKCIMGGSAGGNLSAAVGLKYSSNPQLRPSGLIVACPQICDPEVLPEEYKKRFTPELYTDSPMIVRESMTIAAKWYAAPDPTDPLYCPLLHPDIKFLPPTYVAATTKDPTHQETVFFAEELRKQGVEVDLVEWVGWPHFFWIIPMLAKSTEFMDVWNVKLRSFIALVN